MITHKTHLLCFRLLLLIAFSFIDCVKSSAQSMTVKLDMVNMLLGTPRLGIEKSIGNKSTVNVEVSYEGWNLTNNMRMRHLFVQPEVRFWNKYKYWGSFWGINIFAAQYNIGGIGYIGLDKSRVQGMLFGGGFTYGYQWIIGERFNVEATLGVGYSRINYSKYKCEVCGDFEGDGTLDHIGPTKVGVSIVYLL